MGHAALGTYSVLAVVSVCCPHPEGRLFTCYSPVCHSILKRASSFRLFVRLACVKHAASVRPEPGSNSPWYYGKSSFWLVLTYCLFILTQWNLIYIRPRTLAFIWFVLFSFQRSLAVWRLVYLTAFTFSCQPLFICFFALYIKSTGHTKSCIPRTLYSPIRRYLQFSTDS